MLLHPGLHGPPPLAVTLRRSKQQTERNAEARKAEFHRSAYRSGFINHLIEDVDEDLVPDRLQAGSAVVPVRGAAKGDRWMAAEGRLAGVCFFGFCGMFLQFSPEWELQILVPAGVGPFSRAGLKHRALEGNLHKGPDLHLDHTDVRVFKDPPMGIQIQS